MNSTTPWTDDDLSRLLTDSRPEMRRAGLWLLAEGNGEGDDRLALQALADPAELVGTAAVDVLKHKYPWLALTPFEVGDVPEHVLAAPESGRWRRLHAAIDAVVQAGAIDKTALPRWLQLPGCLPDVEAALQRARQSRLAAALGRARDRAGLEPVQIMLAPTYDCNLGCEYCYARTWQQRFGGHMTAADLQSFFRWVAAQRCHRVTLCGGEPTQYCRFAELVGLAQSHQVKLTLTTNNLFNEDVRAAFTAEVIDETVIHYDQTRMLADPELCQRFLANLAFLCRAGARPMFRYTVTADDPREQWERMLDAAAHHGVERINYALAFQNWDRNNAYYAIETHPADPAVRRTVLDFVGAVHARGMRAWLCKPLPLCCFTDHEQQPLIAAGALRSACAAYMSGYTRNLTVNPDLSTLPCNAIAVRGPALRPNTGLEEYSTHNRGVILPLLRQPYREACRSCVYWYRGLCQGACLTEQRVGPKGAEPCP